MPIDAVTAKAIIDEVNSLVDGVGVGFVKVRVRGRRAQRIYSNASKPVPTVRALPDDIRCPRDGGVLHRIGDGEGRRYDCTTCKYRWRTEQLLKLIRADAGRVTTFGENGSGHSAPHPV